VPPRRQGRASARQRSGGRGAAVDIGAGSP